jgi:hypothetical protein
LLLLPPGVDKASGVMEALKELGVSRHNLVAIGDGENDLPLFAAAGHAVAVSNAGPEARRQADHTTRRAYCDGFLELAHELATSDLPGAVPRHRLVLGCRDDQQEVSLVPCWDSLLVSGPDDAGRALVCNRLLEQLLSRDYQCCVIGAERTVQEATPGGMMNWGDAHEVPRLTDILAALEHPTLSVNINLAALSMETRPVFVDALLLQLQALHERVGRPHCILIHQAHRFLVGSQAAAATARLSEVTMIYSSAEPEQLPPHVLDGVSLVIVAGAGGDAAPASNFQAIAAGGAVCGMSLFTPGPAGTRSPSDEVTASGY